MGESACYARWAFRDVELPRSEVLEVRVSRHLLEDVRLEVAFHRFAILPEVDPAVGVGPRVGQPSLVDEPRQLGEGGAADSIRGLRYIADQLASRAKQRVAGMVASRGGSGAGGFRRGGVGVIAALLIAYA